MSLLDGLRYRWHAWRNPRAYDRELADERAFHLELEAMQQAHRAHGALSSADAAAAARRRFGNVTTLHEESRQMAGLSFRETFAQDVRFALRSFRRAPTFTLVATLTLAIGIGANTAIFSALDALLLRPLPFAEPDRLMKVSLTRPPNGDRPANDDAVWSYPKFQIFEREQRAFSTVALHSAFEVTVHSGEGAERVRFEDVHGPYFETLGVRPALGRTFVREEDAPNGPKAVIIAHSLFTRMFNADSAVVGRTMRISGATWTIVGVMPEGFRGMSGRAELWQPLLAVNPSAPNEKWSHQWEAVARLKPGVSAAQAKSAVRTLGAEIDRIIPDPDVATLAHGAIARELDGLRIDPKVRNSLYVMLAAVGLVLLIACANVANLFLVRAAGRAHEISVRLAMGATRRRLVRQLLTESTLLALGGGALGLVIAWGAVRVLSGIDPTRAFSVRNLTGIGAVTFDGIRVNMPALGVALLLSLLTGLLFGLVPALHATRSSVADGLRRGKGRGRARMFGVNTRNVLVALEIAVAVVLLASAGLTLRSLGKLLDVSPGFDPSHLLTMRLNSPDGAPRDSTPAFYARVIDRLSAVPGVTAVTMQDCPPLNGGCNGTAMWSRDPGKPAEPRPGVDPDVGVHWITANWPATMGVRLIAGRFFAESDRRDAEKVVLLSERAAKALFPDAKSAIGRQIGVGQGGFDMARVVGVVSDVRYGSIDEEPISDVYMPHAQTPRGRMMLMVRTSLDPETMVSAVRAAVREVAPEVPLYDLRTMESRLADSTAYIRFGGTLLALFAAVALLLAALGVYGVISFAVSQRTREIGIRMALGAVAPRVARAIVGEGLGVAAAGATIGLLVAVGSTKLLGSLLYGVTPTDPATFVAIVVLMLACVGVASWVPARRAARIAPTEALREE